VGHVPESGIASFMLGPPPSRCSAAGAFLAQRISRASRRQLRSRFPAGEVTSQPGSDLLGFTASPLLIEQEAVQVERDQGQHFAFALLHELAFLLEGAVDLVVNPPACQRVPGTTQQDLDLMIFGMPLLGTPAIRDPAARPSPPNSDATGRGVS